MTRQIYEIPYGVKTYILIHLVACIKLMHLFRIEFQMFVMSRSFPYIMVRILELNFLKNSNQSEGRNRSGRESNDGCQSE